jgi:hypothetical protein
LCHLRHLRLCPRRRWGPLCLLCPLWDCRSMSPRVGGSGGGERAAGSAPSCWPRLRWRLKATTERSHRVAHRCIRGRGPLGVGPRPGRHEGGGPAAVPTPWSPVRASRPWRYGCAKRWVSAPAWPARKLHRCRGRTCPREVLGHTGLGRLVRDKGCAVAGGVRCTRVDGITSRALRLSCPRGILRVRASRWLRHQRRLLGGMRGRRIEWGNKRCDGGCPHRVLVLFGDLGVSAICASRAMRRVDSTPTEVRGRSQQSSSTIAMHNYKR